jgi:hypothetical protein
LLKCVLQLLLLLIGERVKLDVFQSDMSHHPSPLFDQNNLYSANNASLGKTIESPQ